MLGSGGAEGSGSPLRGPGLCQEGAQWGWVCTQVDNSCQQLLLFLIILTPSPECLPPWNCSGWQRKAGTIGPSPFPPHPHCCSKQDTALPGTGWASPLPVTPRTGAVPMGGSSAVMQIPEQRPGRLLYQPLRAAATRQTAARHGSACTPSQLQLPSAQMCWDTLGTGRSKLFDILHVPGLWHRCLLQKMPTSECA